MKNELAVLEKTILDQEKSFVSIAESHKAVKFKAEAEFALQILKGKKYLCDIAKQNPASLEAAIMNVAAIGISLNPAARHAYLVSRDRKVILDISYMGFVHLAVSSGSIDMVQARLVFQKDEYKSMPIGQLPIHHYDAFSDDRGEIKGVYAAAKTETGSFIVDEMSIRDVLKIRDRASESFKSGKQSPWKTDLGEMVKKTVIKRGSKLWPKVGERLQKAIAVSNESEGIDFTKESGPASPEKLGELKTVLAKIENGEERLLKHLSDKAGAKIEALEDLSISEVTYSINFLKQYVK